MDPVVHCDLDKKVSVGGEKLEIRVHTILLKKGSGSWKGTWDQECFFVLFFFVRRETLQHLCGWE